VRTGDDRIEMDPDRRVESAALSSPWLDLESRRRVAAAFAESPARGLLGLGTRELDTALPPVAGWWRELARRYLTQLCHTPDLEQGVAPVAPPAETELSALAGTAPPMRGGEYLNAEVLADPRRRAAHRSGKAVAAQRGRWSGVGPRPMGRGRSRPSKGFRAE
jgi:hypothetical protein